MENHHELSQSAQTESNAPLAENECVISILADFLDP